jgi:hypothetical protein
MPSPTKTSSKALTLHMEKTDHSMTFPEAIQAVIDGKRVTKLEWEANEEPESYGELRDGFLMLWRNGKWHQWLVSDGDLLGKDWIVAE